MRAIIKHSFEIRLILVSQASNYGFRYHLQIYYDRNSQSLCLTVLSLQPKMKILILLIWVFLMNYAAQCLSPYEVLELDDSATSKEVKSQYKRLKGKEGVSKKTKRLYKEAYEEIMIAETLEITNPQREQNSKQTATQAKAAEEKQTQTKKSRRRKRRGRRGLPRISDMFRRDYFVGDDQPKKQKYEIEDEQNYAEELREQREASVANENIERPYELPPEYDDPSYHQKKTEKELKEEKINFNIKVASYLLFLGGIFLKLTPCLIIYCIFKNRKQQKGTGKEDELNPIEKAINGWSGKNRRLYNKKK